MKAKINNRVQHVNVNTGTGPQGKAGRDGVNGAPAEFQFAGGWLQWRLVGSFAWNNLVTEAELEGPMGLAGKDGIDGKDGRNGTNGKDGANGIDGVDGLSVELQKTPTALQWRVIGGTWADLISIAVITGPEGQAGKNGGKGADGSNGTDGANGTDGTDGREIEIQRSATHLQWRYLGDDEWMNIIPLADIEGTSGSNGKDGVNGKDGKAGIDGANGKSAEFRKTTTDIEWRLEGGVWASLITIAEITGPEGKRGPTGSKGDSFTINAQGMLAGRDAYDSEADGFAYLATDTGALFIRQGASGWSDPIPFGKGEDGKSAYDVSIEAGFVGDVDSWLLSLHGQEVSLRRGATNLEWRLGEGAWKTLIGIVDITGPEGKAGTNGTDGGQGHAGSDGTNGIDGAEGPAGADGREVQIRAFGLFIQWRYVGETEWTDLIALADITGAAGKDGKDGTNGSNGADGKQGIQGIAGIDGREVSLSANSTHIQWRLDEDGWQDLVALADLNGADGAEGPKGKDGTNGTAAEFQTTATHIQWRLVGSMTWIDLLPLSQITGPTGSDGSHGANGREVEIQNAGGFIQWRFIGDPAWINLIAVADLVGPVGPAGTTKWDGIDDKPEAFPPSEHNHDGRYYTKEQIDNALSAYAKLESPTFTGAVKVTGSLTTTGALGSEGT
ncbi:hypothetical protein [Pseudochrobactrum sp. MP213Fo]|uniref:hypothetical protein n=1 Tax=Pseudochrobactrum sp. MP213Fo TaxID=3022250 RepID=UPI003BA10A61